jgi:hypothetical protein
MPQIEEERNFRAHRSGIGGRDAVSAPEPVAQDLREIGRVERTLFVIDRLDNADLRRRANVDLNKGETRHTLARTMLFIAAFAEIIRGSFLRRNPARYALHHRIGTAQRRVNGRDLCQHSRKRIDGQIEQ